jgi:hypothetical protein
MIRSAKGKRQLERLRYRWEGNMKNNGNDKTGTGQELLAGCCGNDISFFTICKEFLGQHRNYQF